MKWFLLWISITVVSSFIVLYLITIAMNWDSLNAESSLQETEEDEKG
jgi:hypothetical protein